MKFRLDISLLCITCNNSILSLYESISEIINIFLLKFYGTNPINNRDVVIAFQNLYFFFSILKSLGKSLTDGCVFLSEFVMELVDLFFKILKLHIFVFFSELCITFSCISDKSKVSFFLFFLDVNLSLSVLFNEGTA